MELHIFVCDVTTLCMDTISLDWNPERARKLMKLKGLRRSFVAERCGYKPRSFNAVINPKPERRPSLAALLLLAQTLGTNVDYLTCKSDDPKPKEVA